MNSVERCRKTGGMKMRIIPVIIVILLVISMYPIKVAAWPSNYDPHDTAMLDAFYAQESAYLEGGSYRTNGDLINNIATSWKKIEWVTVDGVKYLYYINIPDFFLSGELDLSGCEYLYSVSIPQKLNR